MELYKNNRSNNLSTIERFRKKSGFEVARGLTPSAEEEDEPLSIDQNLYSEPEEDIPTAKFTGDTQKT